MTRRPKIGWLEIGFIFLMAAALATRLWELDGRTMHYDEAIHLHYSWKLANLEQYDHSPWMHGPFQIEFTALLLWLLGDSDFIARLGYALFGTALVGLPYFLHRHLGRTGSLFAGLMLAVSPVMLYFSRFGRNDIIMAFWATALLVLLWKYVHEEEDRYLYLASAVLALMFATKETAYFIALIFGSLAFLLALPQVIPALFGRGSLRRIKGPAAFFLLIFTLTLPQWSAAAGVFQDLVGLTLVNPDGVAGGIVGAPHWAGPKVILPVYHAPFWFHSIAVALGEVVLFLIGFKNTPSVNALACRIGVPVLVMASVFLIIFKPLAKVLSPDAVPVPIDVGLAVILLVGCIGVLLALRNPWKLGVALVLGPATLMALYLVLFTPTVNIDALVNGLLPGGIRVDASANGIPVNFVVAGAILLLTFLTGAGIGFLWKGGGWLACAGIFYLVWLALYTTVFTNWTGAFTGIWQGMGYWIAQQEVARGNQPWYYYFVGLSVYELLPIVFGALGALYFLKKGDALGLALAFWAGLSLLAYTLASEKMPWLLVNVVLPFMLLAGQYLGQLAETVQWRTFLRRGSGLLLLLVPATIVGGLFLLRAHLPIDVHWSAVHWLTASGLVAALILAAFIIRLSGPSTGTTMAGLGVAALLLGFGVWTALRAAYTYDDSHLEILVYAQGSADVAETFRELNQRVFSAKEGNTTVNVDYDMWYPFQWYVRKESDQGTVRFSCFKEEGGEGWTPGCIPLKETSESNASALLVTAANISGDSQLLESYEKSGPMKNLLWFPESYRRPGENRQGETAAEEILKDLQFFWDSASNRQTVGKVIDYVLFRDLERDWYKSEYYSYIR